MSNSTSPTSPPVTDWRRTGYYVLIGALALLFALQWGPGSQGCDRFGALTDPKGEPVATVNGQNVPLKDFARLYSAQSANFRAQGVPLDLLKQFGVHKQVVDALVNKELLAQAAELQGIRAADDDVVAIILKDPSFQRDGKFDEDRYADIISQYEGVTTVQWEEKVRRELSGERLLKVVEASAVVSDDEVAARYQKEGNSAKATFVRFTPTMYAEKVAVPKPAELEKWATDNAALIQKDYEANKFKYFIEERVKARQILVRVAREAPEADKADAKKRIENLRKEIVENKKPFADVATGFSEDTETKAKGGDLGFIERTQLPSQFADKLFALKAGEVTEPVETPIGFHLGVVEERKAPETRPLETVRLEIAAQLYTKEKAKDFARADAEKALAELKNGKTLAELFPADAKDEKSNLFNFKAETRPEVKETGEFNASADKVPVLEGGPATFKLLMAQTAAGVIDQVVALDDAVAVVVLDERKTPTDADFATRKEQLKVEAIKGKQFEVREAFLKSLKVNAKVTTNDKAIDKVIGEG